MLKAVLIDDERSSIESLTFELDAYCPDVEVIGSFRDPEKAAQKLIGMGPDLIFLDIEMPGMNGFEFLQKLPAINFDVIFVTAYDQFAVRAFEFNAIDYIMKPVRKTKLIQAVNKVQERQKHSFEQQTLAALIQNLNVQSSSGMEKIALPTGEGFTMVKINDITYLQAESNYTWVFTTGEQKYLVAKTLKEVETMVLRDQFFRSHKSYLANLNHVDRYVRGQGGYLVMTNGEQVPVSRAQRNVLLDKLKGL